MSAFNFSKAIIGGRLTHDPELKTTASGVSVCSFTVAVNRRPDKSGESKADFIECVAWRQTAEFITRFFRKASSICVEGSLQQRSWEDREGKKRTALEIQVEQAYFVDAKNEMPAVRDDSEPPSYIPDSYRVPDGAVKMEDLDSDEPLPF